MARNHLNINKSFMIGNGLLAFGVIFVVIIFIYMSFRLKREIDESDKQFSELYNIELVKGFAGHSYSVYLNDSILLNKRIEKDSVKISVHRFSDSNALLVVNNETEELSTFDLSEKGGTILLYRENGTIFQKGR